MRLCPYRRQACNIPKPCPHLAGRATFSDFADLDVVAANCDHKIADIPAHQRVNADGKWIRVGVDPDAFIEELEKQQLKRSKRATAPPRPL